MSEFYEKTFKQEHDWHKTPIVPYLMPYTVVYECDKCLKRTFRIFDVMEFPQEECKGE